MKKLLIILLLFPLLSFSQNEIGKTRSQIKAQFSQAPCMTDSELLTWCVSNGDQISFAFENNRFKWIFFPLYIVQNMKQILSLKK